MFRTGTGSHDLSALDIGHRDFAIMEQEDRFHALMPSIETAAITFEGTLVLAPVAGLALVFEPAP